MAARGPALRPGIALVEQVFRGERSFVARDPISHKYFRFRPAEAAVIREFDGRRTPDEIASALRDAGVAVSAGAVASFARTLSALGLMEQNLAERTEHQIERLRRERSQRRSLFRGEWFRMRWSVGDADGFFDRVMPWLRWAFTPAFAAASVALFVAYGWIVTARWGEFSAATGALFAPSALDLGRLTLLASVFMGLTLVHELAHGFACKRFGGEVHELGFMLLYLTPAFYCNVNDAWSFPERRARLWVTAAGAWVELALTGVAAIVWLLVAPGTLLADLAVATMVIGGVAAVIANANPLLPLDGYFALSDYLEIPNLRQRAAAHLSWWLRRHVLRLDMPEPTVDPRERRIFLLYGALAAVYVGLFLTWVALTVLGWAYHRIGFLGGALVALGVLVMLRGRLFALWRGVLLAVRVRAGGVRWRRWQRVVPVTVLGGAALAGVAPWDLKAGGPFLVTPVRALAVTAPASGVIAEVLVEEGSLVEPGAPLVRILDPGRFSAAAARMRIADSLAGVERLARARHLAGSEARLAAERRAAEASLRAVAGLLAQDTVRARIGGTVVTRRPEWLLGRRVEAGDTLLLLHDLGGLEARVRLGAAGSARVEPGQRVRLISRLDPARPLEGVVGAVAPHGAAEMAGALEVRVPLARDTWLRPGATGEARVLWRRSSLLGALWWSVRSRVRNDLFL